MSLTPEPSRLRRIISRKRFSRLLSRKRLSLLLLGTGVTLLVVSALLLILTFTGVLGGSSYKGVGEAEAIGDRNFAFTPQPTATTVLAPASEAPLARFAIPRFGVDVPMIALGVDENGAMETPSDPWVVAWYDFTARPGFGSNAVFSGHVDALYTGNPGPAVFWNLKDLVDGDIIEVRLEDGSLYQYRVSARYSVNPDTADVGAIVGPTEREIITLITCGGTLGTQYDQRLIVLAERVA